MIITSLLFVTTIVILVFVICDLLDGQKKLKTELKIMECIANGRGVSSDNYCKWYQDECDKNCKLVSYYSFKKNLEFELKKFEAKPKKNIKKKLTKKI